MSVLSFFLVALLLPLFPFSMLFNGLFTRFQHPAMRAALLLAWPQIGVTLAYATNLTVASWVMGWAVVTSALYAWRALALRDVGLWTSFIATSTWVLLWIPIHGGVDAARVHLYALGFSAPFVLLVFLATGLKQRFGAAYTGLYGGLALTLPRFSGVLVMVVLAVIATPLFPGFFIMLATVVTAVAAAPVVAAAVAGVWLLWSWAGARLLQGLIVGPATKTASVDMSARATWGYVAVLGAFVMGGLYWVGDLQ